MNDVIAAISAGPAALAESLACDLSTLTAAEIVEATQLAQTIRRGADALISALVAEGARQDAHTVTGQLSMTALVAQEAGISRRQAAQQVRLATQLETAPQLKKAMNRPGMSPEKARIVADSLAALPADLTAAQRSEVEADLTAAAERLPVEQLRRKAARALEIIDAERADRIENHRCREDERRQARHVSFWIGRPDPETGMVCGRFEVDALTGDILRSLMESATAPRKQSQPTTAADRPRLQGEAFVRVVRRLPDSEFGQHGGVPATMLVTVDEATLRGATDRVGVTEHGTSISAGELRRLACGARILPAIMDGDSRVLDLGREKRTHTPAQRRAIAHRDQGCAFPGCDRPPGWCETHHIIPWAVGGPTTVDDGVLLCSRHHHEVHNRGWHLRLDPRENSVEFRRRPGDPWRRNERYRPCLT